MRKTPDYPSSDVGNSGLSVYTLHSHARRPPDDLTEIARRRVRQSETHRLLVGVAVGLITLIAFAGIVVIGAL